MRPHTGELSWVHASRFGEALTLPQFTVLTSTDTLWQAPSGKKPLVVRTLNTPEGNFLVSLLEADRAGEKAEEKGRFPRVFGLTQWQEDQSLPQFSRRNGNNIVATFENSEQLDKLDSALKAIGYTPGQPIEIA